MTLTKLSLSKETLRNLDAQATAQVQGGMAPVTNRREGCQTDFCSVDYCTAAECGTVTC